MQEQKIFQEGDYAITTHRLVWGETVLEMVEVDSVYFEYDDWWKGTGIAVLVGLVFLAIGATWSIVVGLLSLLGAWFIYNERADTLHLTMRDGNKHRLGIKRNRVLFKALNHAITKALAILTDEIHRMREDESKEAMAAIDDLPQA